MSHGDVADAFSRGDRDAKGANMFISGDTIYSYGYHFAIAKRIGCNEYLFNSDGYSVSTTQHKSLVRSALSGSTLWECPDCNMDKLSDDLKYEAENTYKKLIKARSRFPEYINQLRSIRANWESSKKRFKLGDRALTMRLKFEKLNWLSALIVQHRLLGRC
jgi:hypothetical protein